MSHFDEGRVHAVIEAARRHYPEPMALVESWGEPGLADDGHLSFLTECIEVRVEDHQVCLELPLGIGRVCIPVPGFIPDGELASACLHICTTFGIPTGVKVTVSVMGFKVSKSFGKC